jgi:NADH dehydrogenase
MRQSCKLPHVVIIGGGFGGLAAAKALAGSPVRITLVDRRNHHLFQPLLYQVAMAGLSPAEIASPIRAILRGQQNATVLLAEVTGVDLAKHRVTLAGGELDFDYLVFAPGAQSHYFGRDAWAEHAPGLKSLDDALEIRKRVLLAFERAERAPAGPERDRLLTFAVIGGGPTGVELAGAVAELARTVLATEFRAIDTVKTRVVLVEMAPRILASFTPETSAAARAQLEEMGVEVRTGVSVSNIDALGLDVGGERLEAGTVLWGAGVAPNPLAAALGVPLDRGGRVLVEEDCSIPKHPWAFAIGDVAAFFDGKRTLPGVSPVALQQGRFVADLIDREQRGLARPSRFRYVDKGIMATIGRSRAVAEKGRFRLRGFAAWLAWLSVHVWFLVGFRNRVAVMLNWAWSYLTYARGARLITGTFDPRPSLAPGQILDPDPDDDPLLPPATPRDHAARA